MNEHKDGMKKTILVFFFRGGRKSDQRHFEFSLNLISIVRFSSVKKIRYNFATAKSLRNGSDRLISVFDESQFPENFIHHFICSILSNESK